MPRPSSIEQMPPDILEQFYALMRDPRISQLETTRRINELLIACGEDPVSKSSVNRAYKRREKVNEKIRQSREMAKIWIGELGSQPQGEVGKLLNEFVRTVAFESFLEIAESDEPVPPKMIKDMAMAIERLERAASVNLKRDEEIRKQERAKALQEAAERVDTAAQARGMSKEDARFWREKVLMGM